MLVVVVVRVVLVRMRWGCGWGSGRVCRWIVLLREWGCRGRVPTGGSGSVGVCVHVWLGSGVRSIGLLVVLVGGCG